MPSDFVFYYLTRPGGLIVIAIAIALSFALWRKLLGPAVSEVGYLPLVMGFFFAAIGLFAISFWDAYVEFSYRVATNILQEDQRWDRVSAWTVYVFVLSLIFVIPLLGGLAVPAAALLLRKQRFTVAAVTTCLVSFWILFSVCVWFLLPVNDWERTHRLEALIRDLTSNASTIFCIGLPYFVGIYLSTRKYRSDRK